MLYELIAIVRPGSLNEVREIARNAGTQVIRSGGVVRGYTNWGSFRLPKVTTKHQARYTDGHHFIMRFDSSGSVQSSIRRTLGLDPRMINFSVVKLGDKLEEIKDINGKVEWNNISTIAEQIKSTSQ
ncbi:hypothetical protein N7457_008414 [Penicillium paradoxum]|uniref:uncharacterized protein n=1 Tax=Penicillium paradoxum TaxID=176176 RepID=UPI002549BFFF|nr:uncharacterized protein N7457_008414 [Penicillium paradoxum]KAJ5773518.1 hypothetical protein N7457_008414 [Penicillium paradoxum]